MLGRHQVTQNQQLVQPRATLSSPFQRVSLGKDFFTFLKQKNSGNAGKDSSKVLYPLQQLTEGPAPPSASPSTDTLRGAPGNQGYKTSLEMSSGVPLAMSVI